MLGEKPFCQLRHMKCFRTPWPSGQFASIRMVGSQDPGGRSVVKRNGFNRGCACAAPARTRWGHPPVRDEAGIETVFRRPLRPRRGN